LQGRPIRVQYYAYTSVGMLSPGDAFDRYTIEGVVGQGGMAIVYVAYDPRLRRRVALKVVRATDDDRLPHGAQRLVREAQAVAALSDPNVVAVYDVGEGRGEPFIAMELVKGRTLRACMDEAAAPVGERLRWLADIARALAAAHALDIVHRDVKPGNVM